MTDDILLHVPWTLPAPAIEIVEEETKVDKALDVLLLGLTLAIIPILVGLVGVCLWGFIDILRYLL